MTILSGKRGLIMGVANESSAAWGIAKKASELGAELAFTYQMPAFEKRLAPLADSIGADILIPCDVSEENASKIAMEQLSKHWTEIDFVVHAVGFSDKQQLRGAYYNTTRDNFKQTMLISTFSFTELAQASSMMMPNGGSLLTLSYLGGVKTTPNYNVMGVAKAALEASVRYLAVDLGGRNIRVNGVSAGPMKTLAGAAISGARGIFRHSEQNAPLGRNPDIYEVGNAACYLLSDLSSGVTGEIHYVDGGFNNVGVPASDV
ncbi:enoyl-ACP reductase [Alphaproteobacteria bacterium]|jgi:enoyl-[acyl-carrier protein] reductase I|nr:enoyl-ACP reductase [Alphaproteobacteria bacterium]MDA9816063.1 enoyl-ACP reductase [Alphaproteobacteria bacterium]